MAGHVGLFPTPIQQHPLGLPQLLANLAVARSLTSLSRQLRQLRAQLFQHVIDAGQVGLGAFQLQLGLMPTLIKPRDARSLFQNAAAGAGFGVDQFGNAVLPHKRGRMRPGRGIGEQHLHIACPHVLAVGLIGAANIAGDASDDFQLIVVIEPRGRQPFRVVHGQDHLGKVAGRTGGGPGKNHILHRAATHGFGAVFAHDPAQRLQQVGLATAVWPHHTGQPIRDDQIGWINKAFEAGEFEFAKAQKRWVP